MPNAAAQAYPRVANSTSSPRDIEAQALLLAANKLQDVIANADPTGPRTAHALKFNRRLWSVFLGEVLNDGNPQPVEVRQKIANIGIFVLTQTMAQFRRCDRWREAAAALPLPNRACGNRRDDAGRLHPEIAGPPDWFCYRRPDRRSRPRPDR
jgi:flagellar biosynthesis activator protein FlaF